MKDFRYEDGVPYVKDICLDKYDWCDPWKKYDSFYKDKPAPNFAFQIKFDTGYILSVTWGPCTYSDNYHASFNSYLIEYDYTYNLSANLVEVGIKHSDTGRLITFNTGDSVCGYVNSDTVIEVIKKLEDGWCPGYGTELNPASYITKQDPKVEVNEAS